jgi:hypothetical protein
MGHSARNAGSLMSYSNALGSRSGHSARDGESWRSHTAQHAPLVAHSGSHYGMPRWPNGSIGGSVHAHSVGAAPAHAMSSPFFGSSAGRVNPYAQRLEHPFAGYPPVHVAQDGAAHSAPPFHLSSRSAAEEEAHFGSHSGARLSSRHSHMGSAADAYRTDSDSEEDLEKKDRDSRKKIREFVESVWKDPALAVDEPFVVVQDDEVKYLPKYVIPLAQLHSDEDAKELVHICSNILRVAKSISEPEERATWRTMSPPSVFLSEITAYEKRLQSMRNFVLRMLRVQRSDPEVELKKEIHGRPGTVTVNLLHAAFEITEVLDFIFKVQGCVTQSVLMPLTRTVSTLTVALQKRELH